jgi:hypothetical protein
METYRGRIRWCSPQPLLAGFSPTVETNTSKTFASDSGCGMATGTYGEARSYTYQGTAMATTMMYAEVPCTLDTRTLHASAYGVPRNVLVARNSEWTVRQEGGDPATGVINGVAELLRRIRMKTRLIDGVRDKGSPEIV